MKRPTPFRGWAVCQGCSLLVGSRVSGFTEDGLGPNGDRGSECSEKALETDDSALGGDEVLLRLIQLLGQDVDVLLKLLNVAQNKLPLSVDLRDDIGGVSHADLGVQHRIRCVKRLATGST